MVDIPCPFPAIPLTTPRVPVGGFVPPGPILQEVFTAPGDAAGIGFALSQLNTRKAAPLLWVQDKKAIREMGRVFLHGLQDAAGGELVHVTAQDGREALWAMTEGLKCASLGAVIGEIHGDPRILDFTATRRLAVAVERYGVPAFLVRVSGNPDLSGARRRWRVASRPSMPHPHDKKAPGLPAWSLDLFRARDMRPQIWQVSYDGAENRLDMVPTTGAGPVEEDSRKAG